MFSDRTNTVAQPLVANTPAMAMFLIRLPSDCAVVGVVAFADFDLRGMKNLDSLVLQW